MSSKIHRRENYICFYHSAVIDSVFYEISYPKPFFLQRHQLLDDVLKGGHAKTKNICCKKPNL